MEVGVEVWVGVGEGMGFGTEVMIGAKVGTRGSLRDLPS